MSILNDIKSNVSEIGTYDLAAVLAYVVAALVETANITSIYGIDMTQTFAGMTWLTYPVVVMLGAVAYVITTNAIEFERVSYFLNSDEDESVTSELIGLAGTLSIPAMVFFDFAFYNTDVQGSLLGLGVLALGFVGVLFLSSRPDK